MVCKIGLMLLLSAQGSDWFTLYSQHQQERLQTWVPFMVNIPDRLLPDVTRLPDGPPFPAVSYFLHEPLIWLIRIHPWDLQLVVLLCTPYGTKLPAACLHFLVVLKNYGFWICYQCHNFALAPMAVRHSLHICRNSTSKRGIDTPSSSVQFLSHVHPL